jgi:hypothetical protein
VVTGKQPASHYQEEILQTDAAPGISWQFSRAYARIDRHRTEKFPEKTRIYSLPESAPNGWQNHPERFRAKGR